MSVPYALRRHIKSDAERRNPTGHDVQHRKHDFTLKPDAPAILGNTTRYPFQIGRYPWPPLKSGYNNTKIGKRVLKGRWAGMNIFTLTLTERATCGPCNHKLDCYGNAMLNAARQVHGPELEDRLRLQLSGLALDWPEGFVLRLHVLGDFYSIAYVAFWREMFEKHEGLRVWGYTARDPQSEIGAALVKLLHDYRPRFKMRWSDYGGTDLPATISIATPADYPEDTIMCPAQVEKASHCGSCALCWDSDKRIAFAAH